MSDSYCDGLGDCIGECPQGAISFEMREAAAYDEAAVKARMAARKKEPCSGTLPCGCPGTMAKELKHNKPVQKEEIATSRQESELRNWPVQLSLVPVQAPYLQGAKLLLAADCTAFACPNFHKDLLPGKVCLVGCPKLDEVEPYIEKLAQIIKLNGINEDRRGLYGSTMLRRTCKTSRCCNKEIRRGGNFETDKTFDDR